jgi:hypothetical protein
MGTKAVVRELTQNSALGWKFIVNNRILTKNLEGEILQGILIEKTSFNQKIFVWVVAMPWFALDGRYLRFAYRLEGGRFFEGDAKKIADDVTKLIYNDPNLQRVISEPISLQDVIDFEPAIMTHPENFPAGTVLDLAILHALDGQVRTALDMLAALLDRKDSYPLGEASAEIARSVVECLHRSESLQPLLQPLIAANKSRWPIKPIKPGRLKKQTAAKLKQSDQENKEIQPGGGRMVENTYSFSIIFPEPLIVNKHKK